MRKKHNLLATILLIASGGCVSFGDCYDKHPRQIFGTFKCKIQHTEKSCDGMFTPCKGPNVGVPVSGDSTEMPPIPTPDIETTDMEKSFSDLQAKASHPKASEDLKIPTERHHPIVLPTGFFEMVEVKPNVRFAE